VEEEVNVALAPVPAMDVALRHLALPEQLSWLCRVVVK
jgi:hypothetical protein